MKYIQKNISLILISMVGSFIGCQDPEIPDAVPATTTSTLSANFRLVNASPDAPAVDLYINNNKIGTSAAFATGHASYTNVPVTNNGVTGNTAIRVKAATGTIGGTLGSNDIIFRATNIGVGNFQAIDQANVNGANYSVFIVDTVKREVPIRTLNEIKFPDVTYYNTLNGKQISTADYNLLVNKSVAVPIGLVPGGTTDAGGPRFWISQDIFRAPAQFTSSNAEIRFLNIVPNATAVWARLVRTAGSGSASISLATSASYFMSVASGFTPSVGSRSVTSAFTLQTIADALTPFTPNTYTLEIATNAGFTPVVASVPGVSFTVGKAYTIYAAGLWGKSDSKKITACVIQHN
jgi:hypothetical protein